MPANPKYLTPSTWQRFAKITAAIFGGYLVSALCHTALASWLDRPKVIITSSFSAFMLWIVLMIWAFLSKNGWRIWGIYLLLALLLGLTTYLGNTNRSIL